MPEVNPLSAGIKAALLQPQREATRAEPSAELIAEDARDAQECVEAVMATISEIVQVANSDRSFLSLQLIRASCDHGRSLLYLLAHNPLDAAASALALHRAQIESFLRGVFYSHIATEEEFENFFDDDEGPRRRTRKGNWARVSVPDLAVEVQECLNRIENAEPGTGKLGNMVANAWSPLCGMVHGGRAIHALYVDRERQIGCTIPAEIIFQITINTVALVNFSLVFSSVLGGRGDSEENEAIGRPMPRFHEFIARHNARLRSLGWDDMQRHIG